MLPIILLTLLVTAPAALADGRDVLADAQQDNRVDGCYTRADLNEALRLARADQRLYGVLVDVISEAQISNVKVKGQPCGSGRRVPSEGLEDRGGAGAARGGGLLGGVGLGGGGGGRAARRRRGG